MTTREIVSAFKELYSAEVSAALISKVTDAVMAQLAEWQSRLLDAVYPILYLNCIVVKICQDKQVTNKAIYQAFGVNMDGRKELLQFSSIGISWQILGSAYTRQAPRFAGAL